MRGQWQLELEHVSGRTKNFTDLEIDEKILLSLKGTGDTWGITVSCVTANVCLPVLLYCLVILYFLYMHSLSNSCIGIVEMRYKIKITSKTKQIVVWRIHISWGLKQVRWALAYLHWSSCDIEDREVMSLFTLCIELGKTSNSSLQVFGLSWRIISRAVRAYWPNISAWNFLFKQSNVIREGITIKACW